MSREHQQPPRRFIAIPFSSGCRSHSSVDIVDTSRHAGKKPHPQGALRACRLTKTKTAVLILP